MKNSLIKVAPMVLSFVWHETLDIFAFTTQNKLQIVYSPDAINIDQELFDLCSDKINLTS